MLKTIDRLIKQYELDNDTRVTKIDFAKHFGIRYENLNYHLYIKKGKVFNEIALFFNLTPEELRKMINEE